ncbi:MAG TPA: hypothetical protein VFH26_08030 [Gemmatimonadales bacterium]|nr:hypothetical protein [Gemmatimonadales bacterium]
MPAAHRSTRKQKVNHGQRGSLTPPIGRLDGKGRPPDLSVVATLRMGLELESPDQFYDAWLQCWLSDR